MDKSSSSSSNPNNGSASSRSVNAMDTLQTEGVLRNLPPEFDSVYLHKKNRKVRRGFFGSDDFFY